MRNNTEVIKLLKSMGLSPITIVDANKYIKPHSYESMEKYYSEAMKSFECLDAGSIIVLSIPYKHDNRDGVMSMGSMSKDYHKIFDEIALTIREKNIIGNFNHYADTGPLFDRSVALISGLGFKGKNEFVINKYCGSYFYIAYLITEDRFDEYNEKIDYDCGDCDRCMRACPTGAINESAFKPERCLSHITQAVEIDEEFFPYIKTLYGCDICQRVCPYNKNTPNGLDVFKPNEAIDYEKLFLYSNKDYKTIFGDKAFFWRKRNIIKRNAIIRAANLKDKTIEKYIEAEIKKANDYLQPAIKYYFSKINN